MNVIAHGGAGGAVEHPEQRQSVLERAVTAGERTATPVDAVIETVKRLESSPRFNAGVGGAIQSDGVVRTDAGVMCSDREVGAVCSMPGVKHASEAARVVMEETPHVLVAGERAVALANAFDIQTDCDLRSERTTDDWTDLDSPDNDAITDQLAFVRDQFDGTDTVGAVATDGEQVATCTATGGRWCALAGRVGDVPQVGSGFYCTHAGGASATGEGEEIVRVTLARRAVDHLELGREPQDAAELAIEELEDLTGARAGVIVMDPDGSVGRAFNTETMQTSATDE
ncbi:isoaspartyl peptidase/L-asparaginase [Halocatena salina]|uniref:Plant-type L-asparaginase n=1 Tax=Halocatena salina TaxID=2934340 RepID=A0A8U0A175_9EURY|nr:isoaspartyl peptidase/L-asparaginase [Halocatena salina]UPM41737.1 isoaspartyl peptidase/L-asparaginase [Halocatena salina]